MELQPMALVVASGQKCKSLLDCLSTVNLKIDCVENCREALAFLDGRPDVDLVITLASLPDGNWSDILRYMVDHAERASILVSSPAADDHFWSEILWRGVHDLLVEPHDADQVRRAVEGAIRHAYHAIPQPIRQAASASTGVVASGKLFSRSDR